MLVFDGDCGFCTWTVGKLRRFMKPRADIVPWQLTELEPLGLTAQECLTAIQFVRPDGTHVSGGRAAAATLKVSRQPWPIAGVLIDLPGFAQLTELAYRTVAANRYRLPGSTPACKLASPSAQAA